MVVVMKFPALFVAIPSDFCGKIKAISINMILCEIKQQVAGNHEFVCQGDLAGFINKLKC